MFRDRHVRNKKQTIRRILMDYGVDPARPERLLDPVRATQVLSKNSNHRMRW